MLDACLCSTLTYRTVTFSFLSIAKQPQHQFYLTVSFACLKTSDQHSNAHQLMHTQVHTSNLDPKTKFSAILANKTGHDETCK